MPFQKGFVEAQSDDGLLEIFGLKQGWHASLVMVELISAKHIAQVPYFNLKQFIVCQFVFLTVNVKLQLYVLGSSYSIGNQRWRMERCLFANGWRTLEAAIEFRLLNICGNQERAFSIIYD